MSKMTEPAGSAFRCLAAEAGEAGETGHGDDCGCADQHRQAAAGEPEPERSLPPRARLRVHERRM